LTEPEITEFVSFLAAAAELVEVDDAMTAPIRDPEDIHILQTAVSGRAEYLCTLDEHFYDQAVIDFCLNRGITVLSDLDLLRLVRGDVK
jgi:predicted nucleic acid-binding protein